MFKVYLHSLWFQKRFLPNGKEIIPFIIKMSKAEMILKIGRLA